MVLCYFRHFSGEFYEGLGVGAGAEGRGLAEVAALAHALHERDLREQLEAQLRGHPGPAFLPEDRAVQMRASAKAALDAR